MKNNVLKFILILSLLLNASMLGSAAYTHYNQSRHETRPLGCGLQKSGGQVRNYLFEELSLKPDQLRTMHQKASAFHTDLNRKGREIDQKRAFLVNLMRATSPDAKAIDATIAEINRLQLNIQQTAVVHMMEFKGMLDTDQQKKFLALIEGAMAKGTGLQCP